MNKLFFVSMGHTQNIDENGDTLPHLSNICKIYAKFLKFSYALYV